jgi:hypothetical protein
MFFNEKPENEQIELSIFQHEGTLNLIKKELRKQTIDLMIDKIRNLTVFLRK